jgi:hypothetical protein
LRHAYEEVAEDATFVLSDLDFHPLFEALTNTHVASRLYYRVGHVADELLQIATYASPLSASFLLRSCETNFAAKYLAHETGENGPLTPEEKAVAAYASHNGQQLAIWPKTDGSGYMASISGIRAQGPTKELALERWVASTTSEIPFTDGWVYRAKSK